MQQPASGGILACDSLLFAMLNRKSVCVILLCFVYYIFRSFVCLACDIFMCLFCNPCFCGEPFWNLDLVLTVLSGVVGRHHCRLVLLNFVVVANCCAFPHHMQSD